MMCYLASRILSETMVEHGGTWWNQWKMVVSWDFIGFHRNSGFTHAKRVIVQTVNVYQRVILLVMHLIFVLCNAFVLSSFAWMLMGFLWDDCGSLMDLYWILCRTLIEVYNF